MLRNAGVKVETVVARVDEDAIKSAYLADGAPARDIADALAEMKARRVAMHYPDALVLGADQVLVCEGKIFDKPKTVDAACQQLLHLRGKTHMLLSAVVIYQDAAPVWRFIGRAQMVVRDFSDEFLESYIAEQGTELLSTVGGYKLEGPGAQIFSSVQGDYFTVLGLPLLEVLGLLRTRGICRE